MKLKLAAFFVFLLLFVAQVSCTWAQLRPRPQQPQPRPQPQTQPQQQTQPQPQNTSVAKVVDYNLTGFYQHATLMGWAMRSEMQMLDRSQNPFGIVSDRGWMYNFAPRMSDEFTLNRMSYGATPTDDYIWFRSPNAVRIAAGDYDALEMMSLAEMRFDVELIPKHRIRIWGYTEKNPVVDRAFMNVSYQYQWTEKYSFGLRHTFGSAQNDADISVFAQMGDEQKGFIKAEFTGVDYMNNMVEKAADPNNFYSDTVRSFTKQPVMFQISAVSPIYKRFRGELYYTIQTPAEAEIRSLVDNAQNYAFNHSGSFLAGLLEFKTEYFTIGSMYKLMFSKSSRDSAAVIGLRPRYNTNQTEEHKGFYLIASASQVTWDSWFWMIDFNETQRGADFGGLTPIDRRYIHDENRLLVHNRIYVRPDYRGWLFGIEHLADLRDKNVDVPDRQVGEAIPNNYNPLANAFPGSFHSNNNRMIFIAGYQFHPRAIVQVGYGLDLDVDVHRVAAGDRYDNAFLKIEYRW